MARARPGLAIAVNAILERHGEKGRKLSLRQAERLTGLSPATIGELAKGNARTPETIRRFALGMNEEVERLLLLAGFVPADSQVTQSPEEDCGPPASGELTEVSCSLTQEEKMYLDQLGQALAKLPPGQVREYWKNSLRLNTQLIESYLNRA